MSAQTFTYCINKCDAITQLSNNWNDFAEDNGGCCASAKRHSLWEYIQDIETQHLYKEIFKKVRADKHARSLPFRCDSPSEHRYLTLTVAPLPNDALKITSKIERTETRPTVKLLDCNIPRSKDLVILCSMCKKIKVSPEEWLEIEEGLVQLKIFEADIMPRLSHGLCPNCFELAMAEVDALDD